MTKQLEALIARILKLASLAEQTNINESSESWVAYLNEVSPANVRELIAALEQAQQQSDSWRNIAQKNIFERGKDIFALDAARKRIEKLEACQLVLPEGLQPDTAKLVCTFAEALAAKLRKSEIKYGYDSDWKKDGWQRQCLAHFHQHIGKGDPIDVAAYCAFMWHHNWPTVASPLAVKLPPIFWYEHDDLSADVPVMDARKVKAAIRAAGGTVSEGE